MIKPIKGYEGLYTIDEYGNVFNSKNKKMKCSIDRYGYCYLELTKEGKSKKHKIHRLVAENFIENKFNKPCVDHIDRNRKNNFYANLRWVTFKENSNNEKTIEHLKKIGEKYKKEYGKKIKDKKGNVYISIIEASRELGIPRSTIQYHLKNNTGDYEYE